MHENVSSDLLACMNAIHAAPCLRVLTCLGYGKFLVMSNGLTLVMHVSIKHIYIGVGTRGARGPCMAPSHLGSRTQNHTCA